MNCLNCGTVVGDYDTVCQVCGTPISHQNVQSVRPSYPDQAYYDQQAGYGQPVNYGQQTGYDQSVNYGQQAGYGQSVNYGQQAGYGQPVNYGQQEGYGQPVNYGQQADSNPSNNYGQKNGNAIVAEGTKVGSAGLILGIIGLVFGWIGGGFLFGIPGLIISIVSLKKSAAGAQGRGKARAGIIVSSIAVGSLAIYAVLMAALAPSIVKYNVKSRLSTAVSDGQTIASAFNATLASEKAYKAACDNYSFGYIGSLNDLLSDTNVFSKELRETIGKDHIEGVATRDLYGNSLDKNYYIYLDPYSNDLTIWYGGWDDSQIVYPYVGDAMQ